LSAIDEVIDSCLPLNCEFLLGLIATAFEGKTPSLGFHQDTRSTFGLIS